MFELYGCPTHYGVGAKGLIKSIDYLTENFKNLQMKFQKSRVKDLSGPI